MSKSSRVLPLEELGEDEIHHKWGFNHLPINQDLEAFQNPNAFIFQNLEPLIMNDPYGLPNVHNQPTFLST